MKKILGSLPAVAFAAFFCLSACGEDSPSSHVADSAASSTEIEGESSSSSAKVAAESVASQKKSSSSKAQDAVSSSVAEPDEMPGSSAPVEETSSSSGRAPAESSADVAGGLSSSAASPESSAAKDDGDGDDGVCSDCDSFTAADPVLTENGGYGSVTTYGSVTEKEASSGGACNYGKTDIHYYAAIHVNVSPGDDKGPWQGGSACGGCVHVRARTPDGWKDVTVRIMDRCPDANCGVDLGGAPASEIMGDRVGRYSGEWEFVSCEGVDGVWDDSTALWVKEGASKFWSIIQVRNPKDAVKKIVFHGTDAENSYELQMVVGTENFWTVPQEVLQSEGEYRVVVSYRTGEDDEWYVNASELTVSEATLYLYEHRK